MAAGTTRTMRDTLQLWRKEVMPGDSRDLGP